MSVFDHPEFDNHEQVDFYYHKASGLKAIIAVHNTHLGPALGGCRMWPYVSSEEALTDVLRLSKGMTYKAAMANLQQGGGKSVIIGDPRKDKSPAMMQAMGRFVDSFSGCYYTAEDSGIAVEDLQEMATQSPYISGIKARYQVQDQTPTGNPSPSTAYGVFIGLKATVKHVLKTDLKGVRVAIQGVGHVGYGVAQLLHSQGAELFVTDIYPQSVDKAVRELGATRVAPEDIYALDVDVFSPCAMGASLNQYTLPKIKAKIIAGAANNQLASEDIGTQLLDRGIVYAPDYVINAGGIIDIYHQNKIDSSNAKMRDHIGGIGDTLLEIYKRANDIGLATNVVANALAEKRFLHRG
jgi:leucine dehydrogenase